MEMQPRSIHWNCTSTVLQLVLSSEHNPCCLVHGQLGRGQMLPLGQSVNIFFFCRQQTKVTATVLAVAWL